MLWVLKRTVSMRRFFSALKHMFKLIGKKVITLYAHKRIGQNFSFEAKPEGSLTQVSK